MSKTTKKENDQKPKKDRSWLGSKSDWRWIWTVLVVISAVYAIYVILSGLWGEVIPVIMVAPLAVHAGLLLAKGKQ